MFNPIFRENVQGRKHPGRCALTEPEVICYRKSKRVVQNEKNGHKNPNNSRNYHDELTGCNWSMPSVTWWLYPYYDIENPEL